MVSLYSLPRHLLALLESPGQSTILGRVLSQAHNPIVSTSIKQNLLTLNRPDVIEQIELSSAAREAKIQQIMSLLPERLGFSDAYASLAVLFYEQGKCDKAIDYLTTASSLDPLRGEYKLLRTKVELYCR